MFEVAASRWMGCAVERGGELIAVLGEFVALGGEIFDAGGTVGGAAVGAVSAAAGVPLAAQMLGFVVLLPVLMTHNVRRFVVPLPDVSETGGSTRGGGLLEAWREPRTLAIGLLVLAFAFTEGSANEWIAYALVDGYGTSETVGAVAFAVFVTAMTIVRLLGGRVLARFGRVPVLRAAVGIAAVGLLMVLVGGSVPVAMVGTVLWGVGAALGFPVGMSAAADDSARAAPREFQLAIDTPSR